MAHPGLVAAVGIGEDGFPLGVGGFAAFVGIAGFVAGTWFGSEGSEAVELGGAGSGERCDMSNLWQFGGNEGGGESAFGVAEHQGFGWVDAVESPGGAEGGDVGSGPA